ncbi:MAG: ASPIC/UnbV domain-containing protein [Planctomycetota bacterium]
MTKSDPQSVCLLIQLFLNDFSVGTRSEGTDEWSQLFELLNAHQESGARQKGGKHPQDVEKFATYWMAAGALAIHERDPAAITCFIRAIELEPNFADAYDGLLNAFELFGDDLQSSTGVEVWEKAVSDPRKQVADTRFFIDQIGAGQDVDGRMSRELGKLLGEMGRPMESVAFQELRVQQQPDARRQLAFTAQFKQRVLTKFPTGRDPSVIRMGLQPMELPGLEALKKRLREKTSTTRQQITKAKDRFADPGIPVFANVSNEVGLRHVYKNADAVIRKQFQIHQSSGTGVACADYDLDGNVDLYFGQGGFRPSKDSKQSKSDQVPSNELYRLLDGRFSETSSLSNADDRRYTHAVTSGDWKQDDFSERGVPFQMPTQVLQHSGEGFFEQRVEGDDDYWSKPHIGRALAKLDHNRDGRVDFVLTDLLEATSLFENQTLSSHRFLQLELVGNPSERDAIGTRVELHVMTADGEKATLIQFVQTGDGYMCKNESALFFGLGDAVRVDAVLLTWPNGDRQSFELLDPDHRYMLVQGQRAAWLRW